MVWVAEMVSRPCCSAWNISEAKGCLLTFRKYSLELVFRSQAAEISPPESGFEERISSESRWERYVRKFSISSNIMQSFLRDRM
jgi:hypothetical protein